LYITSSRYKIPFTATDGTYTLEFMVFDKRGTELLGKNAEILRKQYDFMQIPPEVLAYVGHKFTFIVKILYKSIDAPEPSFEVVLIKEKFGKETFFPKPESCQVLSIGSTSSASSTYKNLPLLVPIGSKKIDHQVQI
jgi:replication factor A1